MTTLPKSRQVQHLIPNIIVAALSAVVVWLSFTQEPAAAYLFPRIISAFMLVMSLWSLARAAFGLSRVGTGLSKEVALNLTPGLILMGVYVFWALKTLGFYTASAAAFLLLFTIYDPTPLTSIRGWAIRIVITAGFMAVMYGLFTVLLQVQVPRGPYF